MKRLIALLIVAVMLVFTAVIVSAETDTEAEAVTETEIESTTEEETIGETETEVVAPVEPEGEKPIVITNFFTRLWEWVVDNRALIASVALDGIIIGLLYIVRKTKTKMDNKIVSDLVEIKKDASTASTATTTTDANVTNAVNGLIDSYNEMIAKYAAQEGLQDDRDKLVASVLETNMAILGILQTVYANNRNIPQGTKDLINYKYAKCLSTLENNEDLKAIAGLVKKEVPYAEQNEGQNH